MKCVIPIQLKYFSMFNIKFLFISAVFLIPTIHYGQHTDEINSNRPGESMSAFAVGKTVIQVETGVFGIQENHSLSNYDANGFGIDMELRYGAFLESLEFIADIQYVNERFTYPMRIDDKADFKQTILGAKYLIYDPNKGYKKEVNLYSWKANHKFNWHQVIPAVAVFAGAAGIPIFSSNCLNCSLSSVILMAFTSTPINRTPKSSQIPFSSASKQRFNAV